MGTDVTKSLLPFFSFLSTSPIFQAHHLVHSIPDHCWWSALRSLRSVILFRTLCFRMALAWHFFLFFSACWHAELLLGARLISGFFITCKRTLISARCFFRAEVNSTNSWFFLFVLFIAALHVGWVLQIDPLLCAILSKTIFKKKILRRCRYFNYIYQPISTKILIGAKSRHSKYL